MTPNLVQAAENQPGVEQADYTISIGTGLVELAPDRIVSTTLYNGQFPGPLVRLTEGKRVVVDIHNETDTPEQLHWHGQFVPVDVDGVAEEGTPYIPAQVSMKAADRARSLCGLPPAAGVARWRYGSSWSDLGSAPSMGMFLTWDVKAAVTSWKIDVVAEFLGHSPLCSS